MFPRRTFLAAMAGALSSPLINLRDTIQDERLMLSFCDPDYSRYDLKSPFGAGSLTYATDSHAMIRAELKNRDEYAHGRIPDVRQIWNDYWNPTGAWVPLEPQMMTPTIFQNDYMVCPQCGDARVSLGDTYPDADDPRLLLNYDPDDNTIADVSCEMCHGDWNGKSISEVLGVQHSSFGLKRIAALPNAMICRSSSKDCSLLFKADGFEGISVGIRP